MSQNENKEDHDCCLYYIGDNPSCGQLNIKRTPSFYDALQLLNPTTTPKLLPNKYHPLPLRAITPITFHYEEAKKQKQIDFIFHLSKQTLLIKEEENTQHHYQSTCRFLSYLMIRRKNSVMFMAHMPSQPVSQNKKKKLPELPSSK